MSPTSLVILLFIIMVIFILYSSLVKKKEGARGDYQEMVQREEFSLELTPLKEENSLGEKKEREVVSPQKSLPYSYGKELLVAMVRDPRCIFSYWDYGPSFSLKGEPKIRLIDITGLPYPHQTMVPACEYVVHLESKNYYVNDCLPDREYSLELGYYQEDGTFITLLKSNKVHMPRDYPLGEVDGDWIILQEIYERYYQGEERDFMAGTAGFVEELQKRRELEVFSLGLPFGEER